MKDLGKFCLGAIALITLPLWVTVYAIGSVVYAAHGLGTELWDLLTKE